MDAGGRAGGGAVMRMIRVLLAACALAAAQAPEEHLRQGREHVREERWEEARAAYTAGARAAPGDIRFPLHLAGIAFKLGDHRTARGHLHAALRIDEGNAYANDFLATLYALDENLDAALKYWNRVERPVAASLRLPPGLRIRPTLLDGLFAFPPMGLIRRDDYLLTRARLEQVGVFPRYRFQVTPQAEGEKFEVEFAATEQAGWGPAGVARYVLPLRGIFFQSVMPEYRNLGGRAVNLSSLARWDRNKRRFGFVLSGPAGDDGSIRQAVYVDHRRERWDLRRSHRSGDAAPADLDLRQLAAGYGFRGIVSHRHAWWVEMEASWRSWPGGVPEGAEFAGGFAPIVRIGLDSRLLDVPERRFAVETGMSVVTGKVMRSGLGAFVQTQGRMEGRWYPRARGEDGAMRMLVRGGRTAGGLPFDQLHVLGIERDTGLWMRGHAGTVDGRKGSAPMGRDSVLATWEVDKVVHRGGFWTLTVGPLLDAGRVWDGRGGFGGPGWLMDAGVQGRVRLLSGPEVTLSWGRDLRGGGSVFYAALGRGPMLGRPFSGGQFLD
ncbi:MAG TPA: hypothetical protein DCY80_04310 [Solibacterales bacterium]|nr:hypothetical protein [Bryobacterales bacterium]